MVNDEMVKEVPFNISKTALREWEKPY